MLESSLPTGAYRQRGGRYITGLSLEERREGLTSEDPQKVLHSYLYHVRRNSK